MRVVEIPVAVLSSSPSQSHARARMRARVCVGVTGCDVLARACLRHPIGGHGSVYFLRNVSVLELEIRKPLLIFVNSGHFYRRQSRKVNMW